MVVEEADAAGMDVLEHVFSKEKVELFETTRDINLQEESAIATLDGKKYFNELKKHDGEYID